MQTKPAAIAAILLGLLFLVAAVLYFVDSASALPGFLPGHVAGGGAEAAVHHTKHGILAVALAACCFVAARFLSGPPAAAPPTA